MIVRAARQTATRLLVVLVWSLVATMATGQTPSAQTSSPTERYRGLRVRDVRLSYEGDVMPEAARDLIDMSPGDIYLPAAVRRSIRQLFALGAFSDVKVEAERVDDEVDVLFRLYPRLEVRSVEMRGLGAPLASLEGRLINEAELKPGDPLDVATLASAAERVVELLRKEGYLWAAVEPEASFQSPSAIVVFHVDPGQKARVGAIEIDGVAPHVEAHVRRELSLEPGGPYSRAKLEERIEKISAAWHELGYYGATIALDAAFDSSAKTAQVDLDIQVDLGPLIRIEVDGSDLSEKAIRKLVPIYGETLFTEDLIEESRANLQGYERERGHRDAVVTVERATTAEGRHLLLRFRVVPGPVFEAAAIEIEGLESLSYAELRALFETRTRRRFRSAPLQEKIWRQDLVVLQSYLARQGFHRASVSERQIASVETPNYLTLVAVVHEGPRAHVGSIQVEGASAVDASSVLTASGLVSGDPFDATGVVEARDRIVSYYAGQGFRQVTVQARTTLDESGERADIAFRIDEAERTRVDRVIVSGLNVTRASSVRQLVTVKSGDPLSPIEILDTRQQLVGSGLFRDVNVEVLPPDPVTNRSDVLISVEEGPRTTFAYGFGFEEQQLLRAEVEVTRRNLFGLNRTISVFTRASFRGGRFITTYRQPNSIIRNLPLFVSLYAEEEQRTSFSYNRVGVGLQISKRLSEDQNLFFRYRFDNTAVFDLRELTIGDLDRRFQPVRIGAVSAASVTDRRDDPLNPKSGQFRIMDVEWSATALGTEAPYLKGLAQQFLYWPLPYRMVAAVGLRFGAAYGSTFAGAPDPLNAFSVPIVERFFAGGATTLRGFALDQASPLQNVLALDPETGEPILDNGEPVVVKGDPVGGNVISLINFELRFPIWGNLRGVAFSDNGAVFRELSEFSFGEWRYNVGFGFRYDTPFGPLRVDYGFKLDRRTFRSIQCPDQTVPCAESFGRWHVSLGHAF